jgi:hypothetical protein
MTEPRIDFDGGLSGDDDMPDDAPTLPAAAAKPKRPRRKAAEPAAEQGPDQRPAGKTVLCGRCSTAAQEVVCFADPQKPGWYKCPRGCGFSHKPRPAYTRLRERAVSGARG